MFSSSSRGRGVKLLLGVFVISFAASFSTVPVDAYLTTPASVLIPRPKTKEPTVHIRPPPFVSPFIAAAQEAAQILPPGDSNQICQVNYSCILDSESNSHNAALSKLRNLTLHLFRKLEAVIHKSTKKSKPARGHTLIRNYLKAINETSDLSCLLQKNDSCWGVLEEILRQMRHSNQGESETVVVVGTEDETENEPGTGTGTGTGTSPTDTEPDTDVNASSRPRPRSRKLLKRAKVVAQTILKAIKTKKITETSNMEDMEQ